MMKRIKFSYLLLGLFISACGGSAQQENDSLQEDTIPVKLLSLKQEASVQAIKVSGVFTTDNEAVLSFKNGGVVHQVYVKEGDAVRAGQVLASLNPTEINAHVSQAKLAAEKAERDFSRAKQLYQDSVATLEQMQNAETAYQVALAQLKTANYNQGESEIRATHAGFVLSRFVNDGQVVGPGTPILQLNNTAGNNWQLKVGLSDKQWALVQVGDSASIHSDVVGTLPAVVYKKSEGIDPASGTFSVFLKVLSTTQEAKIGAGMFAQASIKSRQHEQAWQIPYDAVLDGDAGKAFVFITNDNKTAKRVEVGISSIQQDYIRVSSGLEHAQSLIVSGSAYLTDGSPIRVTNNQ